MIVQLMPAGRQKLVTAQATTTKVAPATYAIGSDYGFSVDLTATDCRPLPAVFSADYQSIYKTIVNVHEVILTVFLPYYLAIVVGNIMVKLSDGSPFLWMIMDQKFQKYSVDEAKHYAGDTYYQSMILRFPYICNLIDFTGIADFYATPYIYDHYFDLPEAITIEANEFVLNTSQNLAVNRDRAIYGTEVYGRRWAIPLMKSVADADFGDSVRGGFAGDGYNY